MTTGDRALNAAVRLMGPDRGHQLLGCDWGTHIATADDLAICTRQARQIVAIHDSDDVIDVKLCWPHRARVFAETTPHEELLA